jgi:hypothetical protein
LRLTSLGRPYLSPLYPVRLIDWKNSFIRAPFAFLAKRLEFFQNGKPYRYNKQRARQIHNFDEDE